MHKYRILGLGVSASVFSTFFLAALSDKALLAIIVFIVLHMATAIELVINCTCKGDQPKATSGPT